MSETPFILTKRKTSPYYQVRFKNPDSASKTKYFPAKSTKETIKSKAIAKAWQMYNETEIKKTSAVEQLKTQELNEDEIRKILSILSNRGILKSFTIKGSKEAIPLVQFLVDFWDSDKSYVLSFQIEHFKDSCLTF